MQFQASNRFGQLENSMIMSIVRVINMIVRVINMTKQQAAPSQARQRAVDTASKCSLL